MGHINTISSSMSPKAVGSGAAAIGEISCRSMATLSRLAPYGGEAPPPYEWTPSVSVEDVVSNGGRGPSPFSRFTRVLFPQVRDLEERLVEKEHELTQMKRNLDESEGAIAQVTLPPTATATPTLLESDAGSLCTLQVFEGKQRLWEKEVEELKRLYAAKLRQVSQHAQRSQRGLQLQLFKAQQEKNRLQEELSRLRRDRGEESGATPKQTSPTLEETRWEVKSEKAENPEGGGA